MTEGVGRGAHLLRNLNREEMGTGDRMVLKGFYPFSQ